MFFRAGMKNTYLLDPPKHRKGAIFRRKMSGIEVFRISGARSAEEIRGIMGQILI